MFGGEVEIKTLPDGRRDYYEHHHFAHQLIRDVDANLKRTETDLIEFHTVLISMKALDLLGPLDEGFQCNSEHGDLCLSVRNAGGKIYLEPESRITYVPPKGLSGADREFFLLRWSRARQEAGCRHLCQKWSVDPDSEGMRACSNWCDQHRRYALGFLPKLKRIIGRKLGSRVEKRVVARWEAWQNRRQFPSHIYGQLFNPSVTVVHQPDAVVCDSGSQAA